MKLKLVEDKSLKETLVNITYGVFDKRVQKIIDVIEESDLQLKGVMDDHEYVVESNDIYYLETVENKTFLYTESKVLENKEKLYQLEKRLQETSFVRISKSVLLNMDHLESVRPLPNYRLEAHLKNHEKLVINRHYIKDVKAYLNL
ncbi:LytTR family DNA-binding domain-containing protein [Marinilactibacillus sp. Marseille-P9653]|uniref:LytTR family DNA-binding domain-containing protein n=1 Tax=Marinilactibacillus sp. Marseille-P9653 TaxID=2866583 RepID=UPI001CE49F99|nr:LytTR family DNA-binding domain-containing protein [Marinilactibacillus sp. Marseille-P9653]